jgi:hypothetical protein
MRNNKGEKTMKVWKLTKDGISLYVSNILDIEGYIPLEYEDVGNKYRLEVVNMTEKDYKNLPEFESF